MSLCPQLCLLDFRALFENKRAPKRGWNANFQKSLKVPRNGVIKTPCAKNQVCKSISMTCSTYRRFTKDKEENTPKWPKKGPQRAKNQNFEKQKKNRFFLMSQGVLCQKIRFLGQKLWPVAREQTDTQTEVLITEYPIRASAFQASACDMSGPIWSLGLYLETFLSVF